MPSQGAGVLSCSGLGHYNLLRVTPTAKRNSYRVAWLVGVATQGSVLRPQPWAVKSQLHYLSAPHSAAPVTFGSELLLLAGGKPKAPPQPSPREGTEKLPLFPFYRRGQTSLSGVYEAFWQRCVMREKSKNRPREGLGTLPNGFLGDVLADM